MSISALSSLPEIGAWPDDPHRHHVAVIGAGIGGLAAAALLAHRGVKVLVAESHDRPGGACTSWIRKVRLRNGEAGRFIFDAGVQDFSGLGQRGPLRALLTELGAGPSVEWRRVFHRYAQDGLCLDVPPEPAQLAQKVAELFPAEAAGFASFLNLIGDIYREFYLDIEQTGGVPMPPQTPDARANWLQRHPSAAQWMERLYVDMLDCFIADPRLKRMLTTIADYITDDPGCLTAGEMAPLFGYYLDGGFYPAGGSQTLANFLVSRIKANGGEVLLRAPVDRILIDDGRAAGIRLAGGDSHRAAYVISNCDVGKLTQLVSPDLFPRRYAQRLAGKMAGPSAILVNLALDFIPDLPARVFITQGEHQFGVGNPSVIDASLAPPGCAAVSLLRLTSEVEARRWFAMNRREYQQAKEAVYKHLLAALAAVIPGVDQRILFQQTGTPRTFERYLSTADGGIYGGPRRQWKPQIETPLSGLLVVGGGTSMGPGVEAVTISGVAAANLIRPKVQALDFG